MRFAVLLFAALVLVVSAAAPVSAQASGSRVGERAPAVTLQTLDGNAVNLGAEIGKAPLLLHFFAAWCSQCHDQMPSLKAAIERYGRDVQFVGIAVSANQSVERARRYVRSHDMTHTILYDTRGQAVEQYNVPTTSYVVVIDKTGRIVFTGSGSNLDIAAAAAKAL